MKPWFVCLLAAGMLAMAGCSGASPSSQAPASGPASSGSSVPAESADSSLSAAVSEQETQEEESKEMTLSLKVNGEVFTVLPADTEAARALMELAGEGPLTLSLQDYSGFEKVGPLGQSLPAQDQQTTTQPGDIVLYQGDQIVLFYGSNRWAYTRLGRVETLTGWEEALGSGDVTVAFRLEG